MGHTRRPGARTIVTRNLASTFGQQMGSYHAKINKTEQVIWYHCGWKTLDQTIAYSLRYEGFEVELIHIAPDTTVFRIIG